MHYKENYKGKIRSKTYRALQFFFEKLLNTCFICSLRHLLQLEIQNIQKRTFYYIVQFKLSIANVELYWLWLKAVHCKKLYFQILIQLKKILPYLPLPITNLTSPLLTIIIHPCIYIKFPKSAKAVPDGLLKLLKNVRWSSSTTL